MNFESLPIDRFLSQIMLHPRVLIITAEWRVEPAEMMKLLTLQFKEIGLFYVYYYNQAFVLEMVIRQLQASPEIAMMIRKSEMQEEDRKSQRNVAG